jgi:hypothetical protein
MALRTKQLRLTDQLHIRSRMLEFLGKKINIVLTDNRVIPGELISISPAGIVLRNMRLKEMPFSFDELSEVYFDIVV